MDRVIPVNRVSMMMHVHGNWVGVKAVMLNETDASGFRVTMEALGQRVIAAEKMQPPVLILPQTGLN